MFRPTKKFQAPPTPLSQEASIDTIKPLDSVNDAQIIDLARRYAADNNGKAECQVAAGMIISQVKNKQFESDVGKLFQHNFYRWLLGKASKEDTRKTPWGAQPLYEDPQVRAYIDMFASKREKYKLELELLKNRVPMGIAECYIYYKYVVAATDTSDNVEYLSDWEHFRAAFDKDKGNDNQQLPFDPDHPTHPRPYSGADGLDKNDQDYYDNNKASGTHPTQQQGFSTGNSGAPKQSQAHDPLLQPTVDFSSITAGLEETRKIAAQQLALQQTALQEKETRRVAKAAKKAAKKPPSDGGGGGQPPGGGGGGATVAAAVPVAADVSSHFTKLTEYHKQLAEQAHTQRMQLEADESEARLKHMKALAAAHNGSLKGIDAKLTDSASMAEAVNKVVDHLAKNKGGMDEVSTHLKTLIARLDKDETVTSQAGDGKPPADGGGGAIKATVDTSALEAKISELGDRIAQMSSGSGNPPDDPPAGATATVTVDTSGIQKSLKELAAQLKTASPTISTSGIESKLDDLLTQISGAAAKGPAPIFIRTDMSGIELKLKELVNTVTASVGKQPPGDGGGGAVLSEAAFEQLSSLQNDLAAKIGAQFAKNAKSAVPITVENKLDVKALTAAITTALAAKKDAPITIDTTGLKASADSIEAAADTIAAGLKSMLDASVSRENTHAAAHKAAMAAHETTMQNILNDIGVKATAHETAAQSINNAMAGTLTGMQGEFTKLINFLNDAPGKTAAQIEAALPAIIAGMAPHLQQQANEYAARVAAHNEAAHKHATDLYGGLMREALARHHALEIESRGLSAQESSSILNSLANQLGAKSEQQREEFFAKLQRSVEQIVTAAGKRLTEAEVVPGAVSAAQIATEAADSVLGDEPIPSAPAMERPAPFAPQGEISVAEVGSAEEQPTPSVMTRKAEGAAWDKVVVDYIERKTREMQVEPEDEPEEMGAGGSKRGKVAAGVAVKIDEDTALEMVGDVVSDIPKWMLEAIETMRTTGDMKGLGETAYRMLPQQYNIEPPKAWDDEFIHGFLTSDIADLPSVNSAPLNIDALSLLAAAAIKAHLIAGKQKGDTGEVRSLFDRFNRVQRGTDGGRIFPVFPDNARNLQVLQLLAASNKDRHVFSDKILGAVAQTITDGTNDGLPFADIFVSAGQMLIRALESLDPADLQGLTAQQLADSLFYRRLRVRSEK